MIEIDFLPVGEETNTGDAILCRFTDLQGGLRVLLVDGGFSTTATDIVEHARTYYNTTRIDLMICTHPDEDHINGLFGVLEQMEVTELAIHDPREYGYTSDTVAADKVGDLITLARAQGTRVTTKVFSGMSFFSDSVRVAGPSESYYQNLLSEQTGGASLMAKAHAAVRASASAFRAALRSLVSDPGEGTLTDNGGTTPRNNTSVILDIQVDGQRALLTGDAGAPALEYAADYLDTSGRSSIGLPDLFDVPHHGSRHNLTTSAMDRLAGPIVGDMQTRSAFASVGKKADDFPRPEVANAFKRRGYMVNATRGRKIMWHHQAPDRPGWGPLTPLGWLETDD